LAKLLENLLFFFLLLFFLAAPSSVAYSESAIGLVLLLWVARLAWRGMGWPFGAVPRLGALVAPLLFWVAASVIATLFALHRVASAEKLLKLLPIGLAFLLPGILASARRLRYALGALVVGGCITSVYGISYYIDDPSSRLGGFVGFYMTTAGLLMQIVLVAFALLFTAGLSRGLRILSGAALPVLLPALFLTDTRGAWIGLVAGLFVLLPLIRKQLAIVPLLLVLFVIAVPGKPRETAFSTIDPNHPRNRERTFMWKAGLEIFRDHPWTGIGLAGMREVYMEYQDPQSKEKPPHLHSVPIHLLASMGVIGFAAWLYLFGALVVWMARTLPLVRAGPPVARATVHAFIGIWAGFVANGLVEWNLGDVEVITLFWAMVGLALAAVGTAEGRRRVAPPPPEEA
jgi:O-antigen ligase